MFSKLSKSLLSNLRNPNRILLLGITTVLALTNMHCNSAGGTTAPPAAADTIKIISPVAGSTAKLNDTNYLVFQIDTTLFNRTGLYLSFSTDSGKCWAVDCFHGGTFPAYKVKPGKGAVRLDTIKWVPADYPYATAGSSVRIKLIDYPPSTITRYTGYFTIGN